MFRGRIYLALFLSLGLVVPQKGRTRSIIPVINNYYSSSFGVAENPLSDKGVWRNGKTDGVDWQDLRVVGGLAYGTQSGLTGPPYDDTTSTINGTWNADQKVEAVISSTNQLTGSNYEELEIRLRTTITANSITGYEINYRVNHDGSQYHQIGWWYGPIGTNICGLGCAFDAVVGEVGYAGGLGATASTTPAFTGLYDGDTIGASIIGDRIKTWVIHLGVTTVINDFDDTCCSGHARFLTGKPGLGHWFHSAAGAASDFGFTRVVITGL